MVTMVTIKNRMIGIIPKTKVEQIEKPMADVPPVPPLKKEGGTVFEPTKIGVFHIVPPKNIMSAAEIKTETKSEIDFFAGIIAAIDCAENPQIESITARTAENENSIDSFFETRGMMQSFRPAESINRNLSAMARKGASFDVAEDSFEITGPENLTEQERLYLADNEKEVLCTLHQRLLMRHLFCDSPELLESFAFEIFERESIRAEENGFYSYETYFAAVSEAARKWYGNLLDTIF